MLWWFLAACSLGPSPESCSTNGQCRDAFGFGYVCAETAYCEPVAVPGRCATTWPEDVFSAPEKYKDALVVGTIYSQEYDEVQRKSTELAFRQYDADPANDGQPVALVHCDTDENVSYDDLDVEAAAAEVTRFLGSDLGVQAIVGPSTSSESLEAVPVADTYDTVMVSPSATSPSLTLVESPPTEGIPGTFWRTVPPDELQTFAIAEDMRLRGVDQLYVIYEDNAYGQPLGQGVADLFQGSTVDVVAYTDLTNLSIAAVPDEGEVLFVSSQSSDVARFLDSLGAVGSFDGTLFFADAAADPSLFSVSADARALFPRIRGTRPQVLTEGYDPYTDFVAAYASVFAQDGAGADSNAYASYSYDAGWMVLFGAARARAVDGRVTGEGISRAFLHLLEGQAVGLGASGYQTASAAFAAGDDVDVFGASGALDYVAGEVDNNIEVWVVVDDEFVVDLVCESGGSCEPPAQ